MTANRETEASERLDDAPQSTRDHPEEPHRNDDLIIPRADDVREHALAALKITDDHAEQEYLEALITVIDYHRDPTFNETIYQTPESRA